MHCEPHWIQQKYCDDKLWSSYHHLPTCLYPTPPAWHLLPCCTVSAVPHLHITTVNSNMNNLVRYSEVGWHGGWCTWLSIPVYIDRPCKSAEAGTVDRFRMKDLNTWPTIHHALKPCSCVCDMEFMDCHGVTCHAWPVAMMVDHRTIRPYRPCSPAWCLAIRWPDMPVPCGILWRAGSSI